MCPNKIQSAILAVLCLISALSFISCESEPEPEPLPLGVYGGFEDRAYIVELEGHDIYDFFYLDGSVTNAYCDDPHTHKISGVVHYANVEGGGCVGWNSDRFVYFPNKTADQAHVKITSYLHYSKGSYNAMPLANAKKYIDVMKRPEVRT